MITRLAAATVITLVVAVAGWAAPMLWSNLTRTERVHYVMGIADGIIFSYNIHTQGKDTTKAPPLIARCPMTNADQDRIISLANRAANEIELINRIVAALAMCGNGWVPP